MKKIFVYFTSVIIVSLIVLAACDTKPTAPVRDNPFDPNNPQTGGDPFTLTAKIGGGGVTVEWQLPDFDALKAFNIYRSETEKTGYDKIGEVQKDKRKYVDKNIENGHSYWYRVTAVNKNDDESKITNTAGVNIKTQPVLVINGGAQYTATRQVNLTILAMSAQKMMLSNSMDFSGTSWESYATSKSWTLPSGAGQKTVYIKVKYDSTESDVVQAVISPQPINPSIAILGDTTQYTPTRDVKLSLSAIGSNLQMKLSEDSTFAGVDWQSYSERPDFQLSAGDGIKKVYAKIKNDFEIESQNVKDGIILDTTPPTIALIVSPDSGIINETNFQFDPTGSSDNLALAADLRIRYDYENNGTYDTGWQQLQITNYEFQIGGGNKTVKMQLKDGAGWQVNTTVAIFVNTRPQASFTATEDNNNPKLWHFDASASTDYEDGTNLDYRWDFDGDGVWDTDWLTQDTVSYAYLNDGDFYAKLSVSDQNALTAEQTVQVSVGPSMTDQDGNVYKIVKIGSQWWMAENLRVTHYRNGDAIPNVTDNTEWTGLSTSAWCAYNNDNGNIDTYGLLYNWYAAVDSRNIAPEGWHVPTDEEWQTLVDYLGGYSVAGGKLKESGTSHWSSPNSGANNESGFSALPGGYRHYNNGTYSNMGNFGYWWSSTEYSSTYAWPRRLNYNNSDVYRDHFSKRYGFSMRLIRD